jgi:hypothetical protein
MATTTRNRFKRAITGLVGLALAALCLAAPVAQADFDDPLFLFTPAPKPFQPLEPPPTGYIESPCGMAVDSDGDFYLADYFHHAVDVFDPDTKYLAQVTDVDPLDGPCGLALDSTDRLYVNDYHRDVVRFGASPAFGSATTIDPVHPTDADAPTGVAVDRSTDTLYVTNRTYVSAYASSGAPVEVLGQPLHIGAGTLGDGYGLAFSKGRLYVPDAATKTVKVYEPSVDTVNPVLTIDGHEVPGGGFTSLHDAAIAVDDTSGNVYVADNLQPGYVEEPEAAVYVFSSTGAYLGRLKHNIVDALPPGLAVDNSPESTQGRVYVTSGNNEFASIYAYPPGAQTAKIVPASKRLGEAPKGTPLPSSGANAAVARAVVADQGSVASPKRKSQKASASEVTQKGALRLALGGKLAPQKLPREGSAPVSVAVDWKLSTTDGTPVPKLKAVRIEINRHGRLDLAGLPTCNVNRIQPASTDRALAACRSSLVGQGTFEADISLAGQEPYATKGKLLVFNGKSHGRPVLFGQIYSPKPFATSFVITFEIQRLKGGTYGTALSAKLPKALASWGNLTAVDMRLSRKYVHAGKQRSFLSAGCPAPKGFPSASFPLTRASFSLAGGVAMSETLTRSCKAR